MQNLVIKTLSAAAAGLLFYGAAASAAPVAYTIEPSHTYPSFEAPHMGISWWRGKFNKTSGSVSLDNAAKTGSVDISIDASSIDFGHDKMNEHAKADDFFNVAKYPTITYKGPISTTAASPAA